MNLGLNKLLKKKVLLKNKYNIMLGLLIVALIVYPKYVLPNCVKQSVKSLLGKVVCVLVILYVASKDMISAVLLIVLFGFVLQKSNTLSFENMTKHYLTLAEFDALEDVADKMAKFTELSDADQQIVTARMK